MRMWPSLPSLSWTMGSSSGSYRAVPNILIHNDCPFIATLSLGAQRLAEAPEALMTGFV